MSNKNKKMSSPSTQDSQVGFRYTPAPTHPIIADIASYWESKCRDGELPRTDNIDPVEIPSLLPNISLIDVEWTPSMTFRVRLFGTKLVETVGEDRTGQTIDEFGARLGAPVRNGLQSRWRRVLTRCVEERTALFAVSEFGDPEKSHLKVHAGTLPLVDKNGEITRILGTMISELRDF